ncbi:diguanylate cyclase [Alkalibacterium sp. 20]|uniref:GGDEF domain-containing protein n=1 Tax=Alkalibacterium sp. 20 TaxID=1798803 RepID=UPI0008FFE535|nr:diguanylate cyclase [Alkalibacterium sp. 20]OJF95498.1 hypothetical protein AX762_06550 [Alkalibacterium sp. 20]
MITDLFVNFSIGISLIFIYMQMRWKSHGKAAAPSLSVLIEGLSGGFMGFLLMYFSISVTAETILDFRYVPIMLMVLFVGKWPAIISSLVIIMSRFYIGINRSAMYAILMVSILLIGYLILNELSKKEERMLKKGLYLTLYSNIVMTCFLVFLVGDLNIDVLILVLWITSTMGGISSVYLVNYIRNSEYLFRKYQIESSTDFLTGLSNARRFEDYWDRVAAEAKAYQESCAILMEETIRMKGSAFRKGGEEFVIVLPKSDKAEALELAENLRANVGKNDFLTNNRVVIPITVSIGVTVYPETINQLADMIEMVDALLYKSKNEGRNRVSV